MYLIDLVLLSEQADLFGQLHELGCCCHMPYLKLIHGSCTSMSPPHLWSVLAACICSCLERATHAFALEIILLSTAMHRNDHPVACNPKLDSRGGYLDMLQSGALDQATNVPGSYLLPLHNEMVYNPRPNAKILLLCLQAAEQGGENLLAKTAEVTSRLSHATLQAFRENGGIR